MLKIKGLRETREAIESLLAGEHLWIRGINDVLIYVGRVSEASFRMSVCSVSRIAKRFFVERAEVDANVSIAEVLKLVEKLGARPCRVIGNDFVEGHMPLPVRDVIVGYTDFVQMVTGFGIRVQVTPR
jgi:hypothetical protein